MKRKFTEKRYFIKTIVRALRETIRIHGPITKLLIGSSAKRIAGALFIKKGE